MIDLKKAYPKGVDKFFRVEGLIVVGGLDPRYEKWVGGGGGLLSAFGPIQKAGGLSASGPIRKAEGGRVCSTLKVQFERREGGGCLADEGEVHYIEGQLYYLLNSARFTIDY